MKFTGHEQDPWCSHTKTAVILTLSLDICMHAYTFGGHGDSVEK